MGLELVKSRKVTTIKIYETDVKFLNYISKLTRIPRIHLLSMTISLLALAILRPREIHGLFREVIEGYEGR